MGFEHYIFIGHCVSDNQVELFTICLSRSFPHSRLITGSVTRLTQWVPQVEQELLTPPEHMSSLPVRVTRVTRRGIVKRPTRTLLFLLAIVLSVLLRNTDSDCSFGIFKLFFILETICIVI